MKRKYVAASYASIAVALTALLLVVGPHAAERTGLRFQVYSGPTFAGEPLVDRIAPEVTLDFLEADPELPRRFFSARWHGFWYVPEAGRYVLRGAGDDRLDVWLDGELLISRRPPADMHEASREIELGAGSHELLVEYAQLGGAYNMRLEWHPYGSRSRTLAHHRLFRERPGAWDVRTASLAAWLKGLVAVIWATPVLIAGMRLTKRYRDILSRIGARATLGWGWNATLRGGLALAVVAVTVRAVVARLPGLDPASLWYDDLILAAAVRMDFWSMLTVPLHVSPGLLVIWRGLYALFPDPEWSLQLLPFVCSIAGIPLMALVVRELTRDNGLAVLAGAVTALNPLLARYSVFVHQYAVEFMMTALFLLAATRLHSGRESDLDPRRFVGVALAAGVAPLFSVTSVFITFPLVNLAAAYAVRNWFRDGRRMRETLFGTAMYNAMVFAAYLFLRNRSSPAMRAEFVDHFMPIESIGQALAFLADNGQRLAEMSLPGWGTVWIPLFGLGLAWLLSRRATRFLGLVIVGFYSARIVASALWVYPLGYDRVEIFTFPVAICLFAASVHAATASFAKPALPRLAVAAVFVWFAIVHPVSAWYFDVAHRPLVQYLSAAARPHDAIVLSEGATYLTAFYGSWPVAFSAAENTTQGSEVRLVRDRTLHLPMSGPQRQARLVQQFLETVRPDRVWYMAFRTRGRAREDAVVATIRGAGYAVNESLRVSNGRLHLGFLLDRKLED